jgi:hypothetical protein
MEASTRIAAIDAAIDPLVKDFIMDVFGDPRTYLVRDEVIKPFVNSQSEVDRLRKALERVSDDIMNRGDDLDSQVLVDFFDEFTARYSFDGDGVASLVYRFPKSGALILSFAHRQSNVFLRQVKLDQKVYFAASSTPTVSSTSNCHITDLEISCAR